MKHTYPLTHIKKWLYWPWDEHRVLRDARSVVYTSEAGRLLTKQSLWMHRVNQAVNFHRNSHPPDNGVELTQNFFNTHPYLQGKSILLLVRGIQEKKGCDLLLDALAQVAGRDGHLHLVMAGSDQIGWVAELKAQAERLEIAHRISWLRMLHRDAKWDAFYVSEVFCLHSYHENFGLVAKDTVTGTLQYLQRGLVLAQRLTTRWLKGRATALRGGLIWRMQPNVCLKFFGSTGVGSRPV